MVRILVNSILKSTLFSIIGDEAEEELEDALESEGGSKGGWHAANNVQQKRRRLILINSFLPRWFYFITFY